MDTHFTHTTYKVRYNLCKNRQATTNNDYGTNQSKSRCNNLGIFSCSARVCTLDFCIVLYIVSVYHLFIFLLFSQTDESNPHVFRLCEKYLIVLVLVGHFLYSFCIGTEGTHRAHITVA